MFSSSRLKSCIPCTTHCTVSSAGAGKVSLVSLTHSVPWWPCLLAGAHRSQGNSRCIPLSSVCSSRPARHALPTAAPISNSNPRTIQQHPAAAAAAAADALVAPRSPYSCSAAVGNRPWWQPSVCTGPGGACAGPGFSGATEGSACCACCAASLL